MSSTKYIVRVAVKEDCREIARLVEELAVFEQLRDQLKIGAKEFEEDGFGPDAFYRCIVAEDAEQGDQGEGDCRRLVGYSLFYYCYSTFQGRSVYLEDVYVTPQCRRQGLGKSMMRKVAQIAKEKRCARLDFIVLSWNQDAIDFHTKLGALDLTAKEKWHLFRIDNKELMALATEENPAC